MSNTMRHSPSQLKYLKQAIRNGLERLGVIGKKTFYSQFGEDGIVMAYFEKKAYNSDPRLLSRLGKVAIPRGFYIDVGAYSPKIYSNTYSFYKLGWHGINIDATPGSKRLFDKVRPRDINLELAISCRSGTIRFFSWGVPSVVNTTSEEHASEWQRRLGKKPDVSEVNCHTLKEILSARLAFGQKIDFLSVDAENYDEEVLPSNDWVAYRPELVMVELDRSDISELQRSSVYQFLVEQGYSMYAWAPPTVMFVDSSKQSNC